MWLIADLWELDEIPEKYNLRLWYSINLPKKIK